MNINQRAIEHLERNEYDAALALFKEAVNESRNVQSLTNLAWIYYHEESDKETALELVKEAISLNSSSHFPYNLLGEIYVELERWEDASIALLNSIAIEPSKEAYNNLAIAKYHLGELDEASVLFLKSAVPSDYTMYSHIKCLIELGRTHEAKCKLDAFSESDEEFVGEVHVAELYFELQCFSEAVHWFEKSWGTYYKTSDWVCRYIYSLIKTNSLNRAVEIANECIQIKINDIQEEHADQCDEDWTESEKAAYIKQLEDDKQEYESIINKISKGFVPPLKFSTSRSSSCYLFGCSRHNHHEYNV
ncbi:tetratricopeptide repeat protein [Paenibacillus alba]|uniref:tetratricopeptide repeat protein n=1 Tax=Paenibacillus alba TaxID=1197127 RepID=UPI001565A745|nr:tetratricopeptide repeat protein [Paenibacillus alba]NQX65661.1 tetratricopeptide repeat protein [Paenibacillus alba]